MSVKDLRSALITGGGGFLGRHLASRLASEGVSVTVIDDLSCPNSTFACRELEHPHITCLQGSICDAEFIGALVQEHHLIAHLACLVGVEETIVQPALTASNLSGTLHIAACLRPDHLILFGSSADVYGLHSVLYDHPMREDDLVVYEHTGVGRWVYARVKALEENVLLNSTASCVVARIFNCYGPGMDEPVPKRVVPHFLHAIRQKQPLRINGDGRQVRSFCYYTDMIEGLMLAIAHGSRHRSSYRGVFNLGNPEPVTIRHLAELMNRIAVEEGVLDEPLPIELGVRLYSQPFDDGWSRIPDISRAYQILGFQPRSDLVQKLRELIRQPIQPTSVTQLYA